MTVRVVENELNGLRWLSLTGPRSEVFRELGRVAGDDIHAVLDGLPEAAHLRQFAATEHGRVVIDQLVEHTRREHSRELQEAADLAAGSRYDPDPLLLANLRGDLGGDDGIGCSDLGWRGDRAFIAHNEDGAPALLGRFMLLTLAIDGEIPVTVQWYPGFLPSNAFAITGVGLAWGINHIQVDCPAAGPGRHFVSRALQHQESLDAAIGYLQKHPSAGGFAYTIGDLASGRVVTVECARGRTAVTEADPVRQPLIWHTNHLRYLEPADTSAPADSESGADGVRAMGQREESEERGCVLDGLVPPPEGADTSWFLDVLSGHTAPTVVRSAAGGDPLMTLCTAVVDLTDQQVTLRPRGTEAVTLSAQDLVAGRSERARAQAV